MMVTRLALERLSTFVSQAFTACGVRERDSLLAAEILCWADLHGVGTHGVANLAGLYVPRLLDGRIVSQAEPERVRDFGATAVVDGHGGLGLTIAAGAMDLAIEKAHEHGVGAVAVRRSSHFGSAGYYTTRAADAGTIGLAMTNLGSQAIVRPPSGAVSMLGTHPISAAAPACNLPPFVLDMSTTVVATGKIRQAQRAGVRIPSGWLVDDYGAPVTDPHAYEAGTGHLQFLGGAPETGAFKGYGLAVLVEILAGILSGSAVGPNSANLSGSADAIQGDEDVGHFFLAISAEAFGPARKFRERLDEMLSTLLRCPASVPGGRVAYPGHPEDQIRLDRLEKGIPIDEPVFESLQELAEQLKIEALILEGVTTDD